MLTTGADVTTGTADNDTIEGAVNPLSSDNTLGATDQIDGGEGTDTLKVNVATNFNGFTGDGKMESVETVTLTSDSNIARDFSFKGATGVETVNVVVPTGKAAINLTNLAAVPAAVNLTGAQAAFTVGFATDVTKGTSDAIKLGLTDVGKVATTGAVQVDVTVAGVEGVTATASGSNAKLIAAAATSVDMTTSGASVLALDTNAAKAVTLAGDGTLNLSGTNLAALDTFDASAYTGKLTLSTANITDAKSIKLGAGDDKVTVTAGDLLANATIEGGAGADTLVLSGVATTVQYEMSDVEAIQLGAGAGVTFSAAKTTGLESVTVTKDADAGATFASLGAQDLAVTLQNSGTGAAAKTFTFDHSGATTLNANFAGTGTTTATDNSDIIQLTKSSSLDMTVSKGNTFNGSVTAVEATSAKLAIAGTVTSGTITANKATSVEVSSVASDSTVKFVASKATTFTSSAVKNLNVAAASDLSGVQTLTVDQTSGKFDGNNFFTALNTATLTGAGNVDLGDVGLKTQEYGLSVNSTGLNGTLEIGTMNTKGANIVLEAAGSLGTVTQAGVLNALNGASVAGDVTLDVSGSLAAVKLGDGSTITGRDVTVNANGNLAAVTVGNVTGRDISLDLQTVGSNQAQVGTITADKSVTLKGTALKSVNDTAAVLINHSSTGTALTVDLVGSSEVDEYTITGAAKTTSITVTGNLGAGADEVSVDSSTNDAAQTLSLAGVTGYTVGTITGGGKDDTLTGGAGDDTITGGAGKDTIKAGAGDDTIIITAANEVGESYDGEGGTDTIEITGTTSVDLSDDTITSIETLDLDDADVQTVTLTGAQYNGFTTKTVGATDILNIKTISGLTLASTAAIDKFQFAAADTGVSITGFTSTTDKIDFDAFAGTKIAFDESLTVGGAGGATTVTAGNFYLVTGGAAGDADTVAAAATAINGAADWSAATAGDVAYFVVVDDDSSAIYKYTEAATPSADVVAAELTLMGTIGAVAVAADFTF